MHKHFGLFVTIHALINLDSDHFRHFVGYLNLIAFKAIDFVPHRVVYLSNLCTQVNFLLSSGHLFLPDPAVDTSDLGLKVGIHGLDSLVFALELIANIAIHLIVALAHLLNSLSALFSFHSIFDIDLVSNVLNLAGPLFLLREQPIDQVGHFDFHSVRLVILNLIEHVSEVVWVFQGINLDAANVLLLFPLFHVHKRHILLQTHQFALYTLKDFV